MEGNKKSFKKNIFLALLQVSIFLVINLQKIIKFDFRLRRAAECGINPTFWATDFWILS